MNRTPALVPVSYTVAWLAALMRLKAMARRDFATRRSKIAASSERMRFRRQLRRMAKDDSHLIDDIGLTRRQVEEEIGRLPFWQR